MTDGLTAGQPKIAHERFLVLHWTSGHEMARLVEDALRFIASHRNYVTRPTVEFAHTATDYGHNTIAVIRYFGPAIEVHYGQPSVLEPVRRSRLIELAGAGCREAGKIGVGISAFARNNQYSTTTTALFLSYDDTPFLASVDVVEAEQPAPVEAVEGLW